MLPNVIFQRAAKNNLLSSTEEKIDWILTFDLNIDRGQTRSLAARAKQTLLSALA